MKNPVTHFEIAATDTKRAHKFYEEVFDWKFADVPDMDYTMIYTTETDENQMIQKKGEINGGIFKKGSKDDSVNVVVETDDIEETKKKIEAAGGKILMGPTEIPNIGTHLRAKDTEGNIVGVMQPAR